MELPGNPECCWVARAGETDYPQPDRSVRTTVAIVGAGIVGLSVACLLAQAGVPATVVEARRIGRAVTGRSTAKITTQHGLIYADLISRLGMASASLYAQANSAAVRQILDWIGQYRIDCDLERRDAYAYTSRAERRAAIEAEVRAARSLGLPADAVSTAPLPFVTAGAVRFADQAQFNPASYLVGLAAAVNDRGGRIFENTRVSDVKRGRRWKLTIGRYRLEAEHVVLATNLPIGGPIPFDRMTRPRCHIAMAYRASAAGMLDGMFIGVDRPTHSLRMGRDDQGPLLVTLGPSFVTGHDGDVARRFRQLDRWVRRNVPAGGVAWRWVNEDYDSPDRVPYAGSVGRKAPGLYVATGFNAWGISNGTAAAMLIADQIVGRANPWAALYDPERKGRDDFNQGGESQSPVRRIDAIAAGSGGVIKRGKQKIAIWKSAAGKPRAVSASCTHLGCTVTWNNAERTWDCPCHGSVFSCDGNVIHGPATRPLTRVAVPKGD